MRTPGTFRIRRSPHLVCYWVRSGLVVHNYATGAAAGATPLVCSLLDFCDKWRSPAQVRAFTGDDTRATPALVNRLISIGFLQRSDRSPDPRETAMQAFNAWNPSAGFFHTTTRDVRFLPARRAARMFARQARTWPMPAPVKHLKGAPVRLLPRPRIARGLSGRAALAPYVATLLAPRPVARKISPRCSGCRAASSSGSGLRDSGSRLRRRLPAARGTP